MHKTKQAAFTMLELVMVIVVLGILAALAMPRVKRDISQEAADNILSAIRYTQHLALTDNVKGNDGAGTVAFRKRWHRSFWRFGIQKCSDTGLFYYIGSDRDREGNIDANEEALDPMNGLRLNGLNTSNCAQTIQNGSSPNIFITKKYGISDGGVTYSGGCSAAAKHIAFDYLGRPHTAITSSNTPDYATVLKQDCNLTFNFDDAEYASFTVTIEKETGHAFIVGQPDS
ncbi:Putative periplasmic ATP /GTP-binding protein [hydrothermal vent metagenome]|uniref:Putative periplasmic ATP /GTP-binding protein n=1 Tax=hydrothermal vent metagenome TaxID=652676 RepID=A0A1W1B9B0_9ZZZZ